MADIEEVVVTSTGQGGWCGECDTLKIDVANLNEKNDALQKRNDALEIRVGFVFARDIISEVIAIVYDRIAFKQNGQFVCGYGDVHRLRRQYSESPRYMSALNKALLTSVAKILGKESLDNCLEFDIICAFKADRNRQVHHLPSISEAKETIKLYCTNDSHIPFVKKECTENCFLLFAEKVCGLQQETVRFWNIHERSLIRNV